MAYTSSVSRVTNDQFITIRASYVRICNGNVVAAALISYFEGWHNFKLKAIRDWQKQRVGNQPNTWQHHTGKELEQGIMGIGKRHSIDQAKQQLVSMGIITIGRNPDAKFAFDATLHYQFDPSTVSNLLAFVENSRSGTYVEIDVSEDAEIGKSEFAENSAAISKDSPNHSTDDSLSADAGGDKKPGPDKKVNGKKRSAPGAGDVHWQRWVDTWFLFYQGLHKDRKPMFNPAQASALKKLREYLCDIAIAEEGQTPEDAGFALWEFILASWSKLDDWLQTQFDLTVVLKKINDILNRLLNGTTTNRGAAAGGTQAGTSAARVRALKDF